MLDNEGYDPILGEVAVSGMEESLAQQAINQALDGNWEEAVKANQKILKTDPNDIDSMNRIARAFFELGNISKAKQFTQKVLKLDPTNSIAGKCLLKWKVLKNGVKEDHEISTSETFLEDPGKTKLIDLIHIGANDVTAKLVAGDTISFLCHPHRVSAVTSDGKYIGRLPDDLASRLGKLIRMGNKYQVLVKSVDKKTVRIFVREIEKCKEANNIISFPGEKIDYVSFTPPELVHKKEIPTEET